MFSKKTSQLIMVWLLPVILFAGLFWPVLGYIVFFMMVFFLALSYFRGRFWCSRLCPRGAFLDLVLSRVSLKKGIPSFMASSAFRWTVFGLFMAFFIFQFVFSEKNLAAVGFVFVRMCLVTTLISVVLGIPGNQRTWCIMCPMGTLQSAIHSLNKE